MYAIHATVFGDIKHLYIIKYISYMVLFCVHDVRAGVCAGVRSFMRVCLRVCMHACTCVRACVPACVRGGTEKELGDNNNNPKQSAGI